MDEPLIVLAGASPALEHAARDANPGAEIIRIEHAETPAETPAALPKQIGPVEILPCTEEQKGKPCSICSDDPSSKPFDLGEKIATVPTDQGVLVQHALCHFAMRCLNLQQLLSNEVHNSEQLAAALQETQKLQRATHQTFAAVIAKTGRVRLHQHNFERALMANCKLDIKTDASDESTTISLVGASVIHLATEVPR